MTGIVDAINDFIADRYSGYNLKQYGFCELMRKTAGEGEAEQVFPVTIPSNSYVQRENVTLNDRYSLITWIRWVNPTVYEASEEWSFGKSEARVGNLTLRVVFANKTTLGEDMVFDFVNALPSKFAVSGFEFVHVDGAPNIDPDHDAVYAAEMGNTSYEKHRFNWNLYAVNITMQFLQCEQLTP